MESGELSRSLNLLAMSSVIVSIGVIFSKLATYVYRIAVARYYGPEVYGTFVISLMVLGWVATIASLGLSQGILRYVSLYREKKNVRRVKYIVRSSLYISLITGAIGAAFMFFTAETLAIKVFESPDLIFYLKLFSLLVPISLFTNVYMGVMKSYEEIGWYSFIFNILQSGVKLIALGIFIYVGIEQKAVPISHFLAISVMLIGSYLFCRIRIREALGNSKLKEPGVLKDLLSYSWPTLFYGVVFSFLFWIDTFFIGYYLGAMEVGWYNAALPIAALLGVAPEIFMQLFFPLITKSLTRKDKDMVSDLSKQVGKWIFILNIPIVLFMIFFPGALINIFFGEEYLIASQSLQILAVGQFAWAISMVSLNLLSAVGKSKKILVDLIISGIFNMIFNAILIPIYGINGAAFSTAISFILLSALFVVQARKHAKAVPFRRKMLPIMLTAIFPLVIILLLRRVVSVNIISLVLLGLLFVLIYVLLILFTGSLDKNDVSVIKGFFSKVRRKS